MAKSPVQIVKEKDECRSNRTNFETYWQTLHDYFDNVGLDVNTTNYPGTELSINRLYDTYTLEAADILAAGLHNYLTPAATRWFGLRTQDPLKMEKKRVLHYLKDIESEVIHTLNRSNFYDVMPEFYKKSGVYGTSILFEEADDHSHVRFYSLDIKNVFIVEDHTGRVVEYYIEFEYTATQAVSRFGIENVHEEVRKAHIENRDSEKKFKYTLYIGPNWNRDSMSLTSENKEWIAQWIDDKNKHEISKGGFDELPALTHRFYKRSDSPWGYSPAMKCLIDGRMLNAKAKTNLRAEMKAVDPPQAMPHNAFLSPYNGNPRGTNFYKQGKLSKDDIFSFGNQGNPNLGRESIEYSISRVRSHMFTDVFLMFDNITKQMNNPEVYEKITEKMTLLGPAVGRFITVNDDIITRTVNILSRKGMLPEPPPEIQEDPEYEIEYLSTLAKAQRNGELKSLQNALTLSSGLAQFSPEVLDKINPDKGIDVIWGITGAPVQMLRDDEEVQAIRDGRQEAQAAQQRMEMLGAGADIALKGTQANKNVRETQAIGGE